MMIQKVFIFYIQDRIGIRTTRNDTRRSLYCSWVIPNHNQSTQGSLGALGDWGHRACTSRMTQDDTVWNQLPLISEAKLGKMTRILKNNKKCNLRKLL